MNNILSDAIGIDSVIQMTQDTLYSKLSSKWDGDLTGYGRVFNNINHNSDNSIPQWWDSVKLDYSDVMYNDEVSGTFCFIDSSTHDSEDGEVFTSDVKCVFMVNLNKILPNYAERADAKAQMDVLNILQDLAPNGFTINRVEKGVNNVFNGFDVSKILNTDIQPKHCFSVNIKLSYHLKCS